LERHFFDDSWNRVAISFFIVVSTSSHPFCSHGQVQTENGKSRPFELILEHHDPETAQPHLRDIIMDKVGSPPPADAANRHFISSPHQGYDRGTMREMVMCCDIFELIVSWLAPRSLSVLACTCRKGRECCSRDEAWRPWLNRMWRTGSHAGNPAFFRACNASKVSFSASALT
jgi:hypothetical protein